MVVHKMNSYFNAGYHDWQSSELHHYAANRFCTSPSLTTSTASSQANLYAPNNSYHSYMHSNVSPQLNYASNMGYGALPPSPPSHRYGESGGTSRNVFGGHAVGSTLASFPSSNLQSHLYGDHIVFGNLSAHYPVSTSELTYHSEIASQPSSEHLVPSESLRNSSPDHLPATEKAVNENECPVSESNHIIYPAGCAKLAATYEASATMLKDGASQQSQQTFEDSSPASTPDHSNGPSSALPALSSKAFFPWMKSYTGKHCHCQSALCLCTYSHAHGFHGQFYHNAY